MKDAVDASLDHLKAWMPWARAAPFPLATLESVLAQSVVSFDAGHEWGFSIFDADATRVLGAVGLHPAEPALRALVGTDVVEAGYWLRTDVEGNGYATEATAALVRLAFNELGARRIVICHDPDNAPSAGIPRRLEFRELGILTAEELPRQAGDGSIRRASKIWVLDAPGNRSFSTR